MWHISGVQIKKKYPFENKTQITKEINQLIIDIRNTVARADAAELLRWSLWRKLFFAIEASKSALGETHEYLLSMRMIDYIQSIIASTPAASEISVLSHDECEELAQKVDQLFRCIGNYHSFQSIPENLGCDDKNTAYWSLYVQAQMSKYYLRGTRFPTHIIQFFKEFLLPHNDIFINLYGINATKIIMGLERIQYSFNIRFDDTKSDILKLLDHYKDQELESNKSKIEYVLQIDDENNELRESLISRMCGLELFDLKKLTDWPVLLLNDLSWEQGENADFFMGEQAGWPLNNWPIFQRPFIELNGEYYCFDPFCLFDNFYRVIQRLVLVKQPEYYNFWKEQQTEISESIPFELFQKILPNAETLKQVYYKDEQKRLCEADGVIIFDDHIFVLEVKGGQLSCECPANNFESYTKSLQRLLGEPSRQGSRLLSSLAANKELTLYDHNHRPLKQIKWKEFAYSTVCVITIDSLAEMAAKIHHLKSIGICIGKFHIWALSLDDLRVYADIFSNPLIFLHYVEQHFRATKSDYLQLDGETDHLALYLDCNDYSAEAERLGKKFSSIDASHIKWMGLGRDIDQYFNSLYYSTYIPSEKQTERPSQKMPPFLKDTVDFLATTSNPSRRKACSTLLNFAGSAREILAKNIETSQKSGTSKTISLTGDECISVICTTVDSPFDGIEDSLKIARAYACFHQEQERMWLHLQFSPLGKLLDVQYLFIHPVEFSTQEKEYYYSAGKYLAERETQPVYHEKIGRNATCPCGSGKKYKKCCCR